MRPRRTLPLVCTLTLVACDDLGVYATGPAEVFRGALVGVEVGVEDLRDPGR